ALAPWRKEAVTAVQWRRPLASWRSFQIMIQFPGVHLAPCAAPLRPGAAYRVTVKSSSNWAYNCAMRSPVAPWRRLQVFKLPKSCSIAPCAALLRHGAA
ncbi:hypothetical protein L195_g045480, partial [Trifolium pratense]